MSGGVRLTQEVAGVESSLAEAAAPRRRPRAAVHSVAAPSASVIVVNYNAGNLLSRCVQRLLEAPGVGEIIVIDNASADGSLETIRHYAGGTPCLRIVALAHNIGFAAAVNVGSSLCGGEWLLLVNPDCVIEPETVTELMSAAGGAAVGAVGGRLLNPDGTEQRGCRRRLPTIGNTCGRLVGMPRGFGRYRDLNLTGEPLPAEPCDVEAVSGALMMIRRRTLAEIGGLDEGYFLHCEDLDLCRRLRDHGWSIRFAPRGVGVHRQGSCSERNPLRVLWHKHRGMIRYFRKHGGRRALCLVVSAALYLRFVALAPFSLLARLRRVV